MNLSGRPIPQKSAKVGPNTAHLDRVRDLPCVICYEFDMRQNSPTEAHHCKSGRYSQRRTPDCMAIPLCHSHHHKLRAYPGDEGKVGFHNAQDTWEAMYGEDTHWISWVDERLGVK